MQFSVHVIYWFTTSSDSYLNEYSLRKLDFHKTPEHTQSHRYTDTHTHIHTHTHTHLLRFFKDL
jgi:hypothetical protein